MLLFHDSAAERYKTMSPEERQQLLSKWTAWYDGLVAEGKLEHGHPLEPQGRTISGARGERVVDGPYAESKEAVAGYFLVMVQDIEEATEIARRCPSLEIGLKVEIRPVAECCPVLAESRRVTEAELASV